MYSTRAVVSCVPPNVGDDTCMWLDGGSTHHVVMFPDMLFHKTASHINSVLVAAWDEHDVSCCGDLLLETPMESSHLRRFYGYQRSSSISFQSPSLMIKVTV
jgi:hypothetical protein